MRIRRMLAVGTAVAALTLSSLFAATAASAAPQLPSRMAALGDSITQATASCNLLIVCPRNSWATGTDVDSQAQRLRSEGADLRTFNNAIPGATSSSLPLQARFAVWERADYVTIEIGANDACASSVDAMTSVDQFSANVGAALATLAGSRTQPQIFVASIPNLQAMYQANAGNPKAQLMWRVLGTCKAMLAPTATDAQRAAVQTQVDAYNQALATLCGQTPNCWYDGGAVAASSISADDISTVDYFHPSVQGQEALAAVTWSASQWAN